MTKQADIQRKALELELGRDLLNEGLESFLDRLVGPENAARVLAEHPHVAELERERTVLRIQIETAAADAIRGRCTRPQRERCWPANG